MISLFCNGTGHAIQYLLNSVIINRLITVLAVYAQFSVYINQGKAPFSPLKYVLACKLYLNATPCEENDSKTLKVY